MAEGRYFFALWPAVEVRDQIVAMAEKAVVRGRMHRADDLHMTLVFLGQVAESQRRCIEEIAAGISGSPFRLTIDHTGYWPRPKVLWAGTPDTPEPLSQLVFDLKNGLKNCGFEPEGRPYQPHVTLYRKAHEVETGSIAPVIEWPVSDFVLAVSSSAPAGAARYRIVHRWPLRPAVSAGSSSLSSV